MSGNRPKQESIAQRGCFISGVLAVIVLIILRRFLFRLPPLGVLVLAGALWFGFLVIYLRSVGSRGRRPEE